MVDVVVVKGGFSTASLHSGCIFNRKNKTFTMIQSEDTDPIYLRHFCYGAVDYKALVSPVADPECITGDYPASLPLWRVLDEIEASEILGIWVPANQKSCAMSDLARSYKSDGYSVAFAYIYQLTPQMFLSLMYGNLTLLRTTYGYKLLQ